MDLFEASAQNAANRPLAEVLRPQHIDDIIGQDKTLGKSSKLGQMIRKGMMPSLIVWGPPGCGKTTFALALAKTIQAHFESLNAVDSGVKALKEVGEAGKQRRIQFQQKTLLFVDEIHRFNKGQQDVLLPFIEKGDLILVGATTENPSYELNRALLSRCRVIVFDRLQPADLRSLIKKAEQHYQRPLEDILMPEAIDNLLEYSDGDGRRLINSLELIFQYSTLSDPAGKMGIDEMRELLQQAPLGYDKQSELHYDLISAFIKSIRGSDPDAALYYLARMIEGGEDPVFIARRLVILSSEDIGNADPRAITVAVSGLQAVELIGFPEAAINLAQVTTYLASCPKSNASYLGLRKAQEVVARTKTLPVPLSLRSAKTEMAKGLGYGKGYQYPHDFPRGWVEQSYLPEELVGERFYEPTSRGFEKTVQEYLAWMRASKEK